MEYRLLGGTSQRVSEIGLGTWKYKGGAEPLQKGIDLGANLIDTAEMYRTEDAVGAAIKGRRDKVFLATKVSGNHLGYDTVLKAAETSLRLLNDNVIDLYQIHWSNSGVPIHETMRAMEQLVDRGLVRYIGVSNFSVAELKEAQQAMSKYPIVSNQVLYNLKKRDIERDLIPYCAENNITVIAYTPLADGSLTGKSRFLPDIGRSILEGIAQDLGKTSAQVALNWCLSRPNMIVIPKSNSVARTVENCGASGWSLTSDQVATLDEAFPLSA
ncbi:MAG: aldo/keto reductase [SAR202 cluster bacterium]|nr:aldo/keto reductase [SAR202 cluster bacterium]